MKSWARTPDYDVRNMKLQPHFMQNYRHTDSLYCKLQFGVTSLHA